MLERGLAELGIASRVSDTQRDQWLALAVLLSSWAQRINLTAHRDPEAILRRLVLDALALSTALPSSPRTADLGSGAGFPGLPLAILQPDSRFVLVESRLKRHHFQRAAVRTLGLENVELVHARAEDAGPEDCSLVLAQAMGPIASVVGWMLPWCARGGQLGVPRGTDTDFETPEGFEQAEIRAYQVPLGGPGRSLWLARKAS